MPIALAGGLAVFTVWQALQKPLDHDEHQFVASGWLLARTGLLPYRDYPYFHLPYLSVVYAAAFLFTDHLLLAARLLSALALLASAGLLYDLVAGAAPIPCRWIACGVIAAWLLEPVTRYTGGLAWNHDLSLAPALGAIWCLTRRDGRARWHFLAGILLAAATGVRATFAIGLAAVGLTLGLQRVGRRRLYAWLAGCAAGAMPLAWFFVAAPSEFVFGNWTYTALNTAWREAHEFERAMTIGGKLGLLAELAVTSPIIILLVLLLGSLAVTGRWQRLDRKVAIAAALTVAMGLAALAPTPTFTQYYYGAIGFGALTLGLVIASLADGRWQAAAIAALLAASVVSVAVRGMEVRWAIAPTTWTPLQAHAMGRWIAERVPSGPVATLAPIVVLEGEREIYPQLATGPFAYRVSALLDADTRRLQRVIGPDDFAQAFADRPPRAILLGYEVEELEEPIALWAQQRRYRYAQLPNGKHLWISP